jgi:hypothetical protein
MKPYSKDLRIRVLAAVEGAFGHHIFDYAVAVGEGCQPFIDELPDVLMSAHFGVGRRMVDVVGSEDLISYVYVPRI